MKKQPSRSSRKTSIKKRTSTSHRSNRLTKADMQALTMLDTLLEEDRRIEKKYTLPFCSPRQVVTSLQQCTICRKDIALLIFGDYATDAAGLEAYARLTGGLIQKTDLLTYIIAPPRDSSDLDSPALLLKVYPSQEEPAFTIPSEWEQHIGKLSHEHCTRE